MTATPDPLDLAALLDFYAASGVDCALEEEPVNRFAVSARPAPPPAHAAPAQAPQRPVAARPTAAPSPASPSPGPSPSAAPFPASAPPPAAPAAPLAGATIPGDAAIMAAREEAAGATSLEALRDALARFEGCNLRLTAKNLVFADGNPEARLMFVGEAPGREEDAQGLPFVGRSGQLLDRMLAAIGHDRGSAYIANVVPWRPPGNRTPTPQEAEICKPFIRRQIELVDPDVLVFLGGASAKLMTGASEGITKLRGKWLDYDTGSRPIRAIATLHPAFLLRTPIQKRLAWRDFLKVKAALEGRD